MRFLYSRRGAEDRSRRRRGSVARGGKRGFEGVWRDFNWPCLNFDVRCTTSRVLRAGEEPKGSGREDGSRGGEETRARQTGREGSPLSCSLHIVVARSQQPIVYQGAPSLPFSLLRPTWNARALIQHSRSHWDAHTETDIFNDTERGDTLRNRAGSDKEGTTDIEARRSEAKRGEVRRGEPRRGSGARECYKRKKEENTQRDGPGRPRESERERGRRWLIVKKRKEEGKRKKKSRTGRQSRSKMSANRILGGKTGG